MATTNNKFAHGIAPGRKGYFGAILRPCVALVLGISLWFAISLRAEDAEETPRPNRTNYASFQSVLQAQMHASSEVPRATQVEAKTDWQSLVVAAEIAVCMMLTFRLLIPKLGQLLDKRLNPANM